MVSHSSRFISFSFDVTALLAISSASVQADVVSYFNFDSGNYVNSQLTPTVTGAPTTVQSGKYGQSMDFAAGDKWTFTGAQLVDFLSSLNKTCTISFWAKVKDDTYSTGSLRNAFWLSNDATFNSGSSNNRNMFTHFAYSSGKAVYFDSGNSGYDRINKSTTPGTDYPVGEWVHWTYVKDANAGTMRVYRNGVEWMSGSSKKRSIAGIVGMTIANDLSLEMDDFVVDNRALSSGEILNLATSTNALVSDVMNRSLSNASMEISPGGIGTVGTMRFIQQQNLAYGRGNYASQINTYGVGAANRAVDGNTNTTWNGGSMIHTAGSAVGDWWQVQFSDTDVPVDKVTIWNRTDSGCTDRLGNFTMAFYTSDPATSTPVYTYTYSGTFPSNGTIDLPETFNASWVRITNGVNKPLNIAEVQIYTPTDNGGFSAASNNGSTISGKQYQSYNMTLSGNSVLTMDVNGSQMDKLSVSGALTMGGTLKFNFIDASAITANDINSMLAANSFSGQFDHIVFTGDDAAGFDNKNIVIRHFSNQNIRAEEMVHWKAAPEDKNFANVNNWSSNPANQNVAVGMYADEASNMTLNTSMELGYMHLAYSAGVGETSLTLQSGANLKVSTMSSGENSPATFTVESGATFTDTGDLLVGHGASDGQSVFNVTGGTVTVNKLRPGYDQGAKGVVNISGGEVTVNTESEIGNNGSGKITISGNGKLTFKGAVRIANMGKAESFINIEDYGEMTVGNLFVGQRGANLGSMTLSGHSKLTITNELNVGTNSGSKGSGTMTLKDYATVTLSGTARSYIGYNAGTSTLNVQDNASFTATGKGLLIAEAGTAVVNQTGGIITLNPTEGSVFLADSTGKATLNISGGKFNIGNTLIAGTRGTVVINLSANGEINADGVVVLAPGYTTGSNTTVNQTGGTFNAKAGVVYGNYYANRGTGVYKLSGGTLNTTSITYGAQTPSSASFELSGTGVANINGTWDEETETQTALGVLSVPTTVSGGTLNVDTISIPSGKALTISGGEVNVGEGGITAAGSYTVTLSGGTIATKSADWSSALNAALSNTVTFEPEEDQTITWSGALTGTGAVKVNDAGTLTLSGANTYSGGTTVAAGVLELTGAAVSAYGPITVGTNGTLEYNLASGQKKKLEIAENNKIVSTGEVIKTGEGTLLINAAQGAVDAESLIVSSGRLDMKSYLTGTLEVGAVTNDNVSTATFSPGNSVGTLTIDGIFVLNSGSTLLIEQDATGMDKLIANSFDIASDSILQLTVGSVVPGATYAIIQDSDSDIADVDFWTSILSPESAYFWNLSVDGSTLYATLNGNAVPEPSTLALLILGAAGLLYWRKRK